MIFTWSIPEPDAVPRLTLLALSLLLAGCGQTGPLFMPSDQNSAPPTPAASESAPSGAAAKDAAPEAAPATAAEPAPAGESVTTP